VKKRPTGITIIAIIFLILGTLSLLWSGIVFGFGGLRTLFGGIFSADQMAAAGTAGAWYGFLGMITAVVQIVTGFGLLSMKKWAWILSLAAIGLSVLQGISGMFTGGPFSLMCGMLGLLIPVMVLVYLLLPGVRSSFEVEG